MNIIIVGCGKVGKILAEQLCIEKHNVTVIDTKADIVERVTNQFDVMGLVANGATYSVLKEAGVSDADLFIAVTDSDEVNLLCCLIARKAAGHCKTIARVRNPQYRDEVNYIKEELGLSVILNPDYDAALEMWRILRFPSANKIDTFAKGKVELLKFEVNEGSVLENKTLIDVSNITKAQVLISAVQRDKEVIIPNGRFVLKAGDKINFLAKPSEAKDFFKRINVETHQVKSVMIVGGGRTAYYLANMLISSGISVKIIENDEKRCEELSEKLPKASIICADGSSQDVLREEGIESTEGFVALTGIDESNIFLSLFAKKYSKTKVLTKVNRMERNDIMETFELESIITPKNISSDMVVSYARARQNSIGSNVETLYKLLDGKVEALEFKVSKDSPITGKPLSQLKLKDNLLIGCISRANEIIIANGQSVLKPNDRVIVITTTSGFEDIKDILA